MTTPHLTDEQRATLRTCQRADAAAQYAAQPSVATRDAYEAARRAEVRAWQRVRPTPRLVHGCAS